MRTNAETVSKSELVVSSRLRPRLLNLEYSASAQVAPKSKSAFSPAEILASFHDAPGLLLTAVVSGKWLKNFKGTGQLCAVWFQTTFSSGNSNGREIHDFVRFKIGLFEVLFKGLTSYKL